MNVPIKIIHKFKNQNRHVQYHIYIFIGDINNTINKILKIIQNLSFYDSLMELTLNEYITLDKYYGEKWYNKFFNFYHILFSIETIKKQNTMKKSLIDKYTKEWYDTHIENYIAGTKKVFHSYKSSIKNEYLLKEKKKVRHATALNEKQEDY